MNYFLVDFENVRTDGIKDLNGVQEGDVMVIFYSENCKSITLDVLDSIFTLKLKYSSFKVKVGTKNALDFQLTSYLGYLIGQGDMDTNYYIVSDDKGFEVVADFWKEQGIDVSCISLKGSLSAPKKEATKKQSLKRRKVKYLQKIWLHWMK